MCVAPVQVIACHASSRQRRFDSTACVTSEDGWFQMACRVGKPADLDPTKRLVPGGLVVWEAVVMPMPIKRFPVINVMRATVLGGDLRVISINGNRRV
jgi:hypothetical protein